MQFSRSEKGTFGILERELKIGAKLRRAKAWSGLDFEFCTVRVLNSGRSKTRRMQSARDRIVPDARLKTATKLPRACDKIRRYVAHTSRVFTREFSDNCPDCVCNFAGILSH